MINYLYQIYRTLNVGDVILAYIAWVGLGDFWFSFPDTKISLFLFSCWCGRLNIKQLFGVITFVILWFCIFLNLFHGLGRFQGHARENIGTYGEARLVLTQHVAIHVSDRCRCPKAVFKHFLSDPLPLIIFFRFVYFLSPYSPWCLPLSWTS